MLDPRSHNLLVVETVPRNRLKFLLASTVEGVHNKVCKVLLPWLAFTGMTQ